MQCASSVCCVWQCACVAGCRCVCTFGDVRGVVLVAVVFVRKWCCFVSSYLLCVFVRGSRRVTRCRCRPYPLLLLQILVDGVCSGEQLLLMVGRSRRTGQRSHRVNPGKEKNVLFAQRWRYESLLHIKCQIFANSNI